MRRKWLPRLKGLTLLPLTTLFVILSVIWLPNLQFTHRLSKLSKKTLLRDVRRRFKASGVEVGKRVEALWEEDLNWYTAIVEKDFQNGTVLIRWDDPDGWPDASVCDLEDVRVLRLSYKPGDLVIALFEEDYEWYNATVVQEKGNGRFLVLWDDPDGWPDLAACPPEHIRMVEVADDYKPGDLVEAMYDEDQTWYTGVVQAQCGHGSYVILWDDPGDSPDTSVCKPRYMKHLRSFTDYQVGDRVDVRSETGEMLPAIVGEVHAGGTFQVQWEGAQTSRRTSCCVCEDMNGIFRDYSVGDRVEALYPDTWEWQVGVVRRQLEYGAFLVRWDHPGSGPSTSMCTPEEMMLLEEDDDNDWLEDGTFQPRSSLEGEEMEPTELGQEEEPNLWQGRGYVACPQPREVQSTQIQLSKCVTMHGHSTHHSRWMVEVSTRPCLTMSPRQRGHRWSWRQQRVSRLLGSTVKRTVPGLRQQRIGAKKNAPKR